jgi:tetratricopeptide (TPR) repeat protein
VVYTADSEPMATGRGRTGGLAALLSCSRRAAVVCLLGLLAAAPLAAQPPAAGPVNAAPAATLTEVRRALETGRYQDVLKIGAPHLADPRIAVLCARAFIATGQYAEAEHLLKTAVEAEQGGDAALELGLLQRLLGRRVEGLRTLQVLLLAPDRAGVQDYVRAGRAARALGRFDEANGYFREAVAVAPNDVAANAAWGELFLEKHNKQDASRSFQTALKANPESGAARLGMARTLADDNPPMAARFARQALEVNPNEVGAHLLLAEMALDDGKRADASAAVETALKVNPNSLEALALKGAIAWLEARTADYEAAVAAALKINPVFGEAYRVVGAVAARNYRFDEAADLTRKAVTLDRELGRAYADLGAHLMRTGDERGARRVLELAFRADPYDVVTYNMLGLLDTLENFETIREGDLVIRLHPSEVAVMREYVPRLAQEALADLSKRWNFTPKGPILIEMFPRHDDFAVRNVGLPGMIGALGACFGKVVTLDSPKARPPGEFNWGATLWHEIAHVITLQLSNQRVPRWLTEGISVWEETRARKEWGREMEIPFAQALTAKKTLPLTELNAGFQNPQTISLAYYEASLLVEHIVQRFGEASLRALVESYGKGLEGDAAITQTLKVDLADLQASFDGYLAKRFDALRAALDVPEGFQPDLPLDKLREAAKQHAGSFPVQMALGFGLKEVAPDEALAAFEKAAQLVPIATGKDSPYVQIAELADAAGDRARAVRALDALTGYDHTDVESARKLAGMLDGPQDAAQRATALARVVAVDPFDPAAHSTLGRTALDGGKADDAIRLFRIALAGGPVDRAAAHADLAESLDRAGLRDEAKKEVLLALEVAPTYARAQDLLLKLVEGGR